MEFKVSVIMITYGHENYISQAIKGVFMQKTSFSVEFIIANDCSPDNSDDIIQKLILCAPENFHLKYTRHERNMGMMPNFIWSLHQANGEYIALCEGDDYWTDENKLQTQVDFLEANQDFTLTFHRVKYLRKGNEVLLDHHAKKTEEGAYTIRDISKVNFINTPSVVFRNFRIDYNSTIFGKKIGDYPLWILLAEQGKLSFIPNIMAVYREGVGVQSSLSRLQQLDNMIDACQKILCYLNNESAKLNIIEQLHYLNNQKVYFQKLKNPIFKKYIVIKDSLTYYLKKIPKIR